MHSIMLISVFNIKPNSQSQVGLKDFANNDCITGVFKFGYIICRVLV